jgi:hypothetical protein
MYSSRWEGGKEIKLNSVAAKDYERSCRSRCGDNRSCSRWEGGKEIKLNSVAANDYRRSSNSSNNIGGSNSNSSGNTNTVIYTLELERGKYYVGKTNIPFAERFKQHCSGEGSAWTREYRPIREVPNSQYLSTSTHDEDNTTVDVMIRHGIDNVRGGMYSMMVLSAEDRLSIKRKIASMDNSCQKCFRRSHFAKDCRTRTDKYGDAVIDASYSNKRSRDNDEDHVTEQAVGSRRKSGPLLENILATAVAAAAIVMSSSGRDINDFSTASFTSSSSSPQIENKSRKQRTSKSTTGRQAVGCVRCGSGSHSVAKCFATYDIDGCVIPVVCQRCGRDHDLSNCYAATDIDGRYIAK